MPANHQPPSRKISVIVKMVVLIGILVAVGAVSAYFGMRVAIRGTEVAVPGVVGLKLEEARQKLAGTDLGLRVTGERYAREEPSGTIVSQHPSEGGRMKAGREVQVIVSLGERVNPVPSLVGASLRAAQVITAQAGYQLGSISQIEIAGGSGEIIQQFPRPDAAEIGSGKIDILLAVEPSNRFIMPDLIGEDINRVTILLEKTGLLIGKINYQKYEGAAMGTVVRQFPEPGYPVRPSDAINLEVAR